MLLTVQKFTSNMMFLGIPGIGDFLNPCPLAQHRFEVISTLVTSYGSKMIS